MKIPSQQYIVITYPWHHDHCRVDPDSMKMESVCVGGGGAIVPFPSTTGMGN